MKKRATHQDLVENGDITLPKGGNIPDENCETVLLSDLDSKRTYKVMSPRLAHKNQAKDFVHEPIEEAPDTGR